MLKGWLMRLLKPRENTHAEVIWRGKAAKDAAEYMSENVDTHIQHLLYRMTTLPDDPNVALTLKGEGRFLYLWTQGLQTAISTGEAASSES